MVPSGPTTESAMYAELRSAAQGAVDHFGHLGSLEALEGDVPIESDYLDHTLAHVGRILAVTATNEQCAEFVLLRTEVGDYLVYGGPNMEGLDGVPVSHPDGNAENLITQLVHRWVQQLVPEGGEGAREQQLRMSTEQLVGLVRLHILENESLLEQIGERDQLIDQLQGQVSSLEAELRRAQISPARLSRFAKSLSVVLLTLVGSFGGAAAPVLLASQPRVEVVHDHDPLQDARDAIELCEALHELSATAEVEQNP